MGSAPAAPPGPSPRSRPIGVQERGRLVLLALLTVGAWALTVHQARTMAMPIGVVARGAVTPDESSDDAPMAGMAMDGAGEAAASGMAGMADAGWTPGGLAGFLVAWAVMMAAMMFPAAAPMLLLFQRVQSQRHAQGAAFAAIWVFAAGYLLVWAAVGGVAWGLVGIGSEVAGRLGAAERATWGPLALGAVVVGADLYQLTPLKRVCLNHCRTPLDFVMRHWRDGPPGALRMGVVHGAYCLGCCWALFAVLVAAGVMSLAWMLLLTLVVFAEKVLPVGRRTARVVGVAFLLLGLLIASGATDMPWTA